MSQEMSMGEPVERVELAPGFSISRVLTGLWQIADMERDGGELDPEVTSGSMRPYVEAGFTTFDMADHYGSSEVIAGRFRKRTGGEPSVELLTKWVPKPGNVTRDDVRAAVQRSLDRMEAERLDLLQFHAWSYSDPGWLDCLFWLQELKDEGLIGHLGLTNVDTAHLRIVLHSGIDVVSNQVCYSLVDQRARARMTDLCVEHGVKLLAFGTVAGGLLTERWLGAPEPDVDSLDTWSQMKYRRFVDVAGGWDAFQGLLGAVRRVADKHLSGPPWSRARAPPGRDAEHRGERAFSRVLETLTWFQIAGCEAVEPCTKHLLRVVRRRDADARRGLSLSCALETDLCPRTGRFKETGSAETNALGGPVMYGLG